MRHCDMWCESILLTACDSKSVVIHAIAHSTLCADLHNIFNNISYMAGCDAQKHRQTSVLRTIHALQTSLIEDWQVGMTKVC